HHSCWQWWHEHLRWIRRGKASRPGQVGIALWQHFVTPGLKQLSVSQATSADDDRGDHAAMAEHRLHSRNGMVQALLRALPEQSRLVVCAVIYPDRNDPHLCDTRTGSLALL